MKPAVIFSIPMSQVEGYCWRWRSVDGKTDSTGEFFQYEDCLSDARASGHSVEPARPFGDINSNAVHVFGRNRYKRHNGRA